MNTSIKYLSFIFYILFRFNPLKILSLHTTLVTHTMYFLQCKDCMFKQCMQLIVYLSPSPQFFHKYFNAYCCSNVCIVTFPIYPISKLPSIFSMTYYSQTCIDVANMIALNTLCQPNKCGQSL